MILQTINPVLIEKLSQLAVQYGETSDALLERCLTYLENPPIDIPAFGQNQTMIHASFPVDILNLLGDAVISIDTSGSITYFSQSNPNIFGYDPAEVIGQRLDILLPESKSAQHQDYIKQFLQSDATNRHMAQRHTVQGKHKNGNLFPIEVSLVKSHYMGQIYATAIVRDVTEREAAVQRLEENEKLLRLMAENATDLICLHEPDGTFLYVSPVVAKLGGYSPEDLLGENPYQFFHPDDIAAIVNSHDLSLEGELVESVVYRWRRKDGVYIWLETTTNPILDEHGNTKNLVTISRDITRRRQIEEELRQERDLLSRIMQTSPSGITVVDKDGHIIFANQRAQAIHGTPHDEFTARSYDSATWKHTDYDGNPWPDEKQPFVRVMQTKQPVWDVRHAIEWSNGKKVYLVINGAPILDEQGEVSKVVFAIEDYTKHKHQQDALELAYAREKHLSEMKSEFITMVSHEFRTPMSIIMTSTGILRMKYPNITAEDFLKRIKKIDMQIKRLDELIRDVTFINKDDMVGHSLQPVPVDLAQFFEQLVDEIMMAYPQHQPVQITQVRPSNPVLLDVAMVQHIFVNLLTNAMKYSSDDGQVCCEYDCDGYELRVTIQDNGIGIPPEDQARLFDIFHRAANVGTVPGTGLGLAIVKRAVDALHGTITFESAVGAGTKFTVRLPLV